MSLVAATWLFDLFGSTLTLHSPTVHGGPSHPRPVLTPRRSADPPDPPANGYAIDQFTQNTCNNRTDKWGGSVENRCRFAREVVSAVAAAVGPTKTAIRLSPHSEFQGMKMAPADLKETFTFLVSALAKDHPKLAYLHLTLPRVSGVIDHADKGEEESIDFLVGALRLGDI